VRRKVPPSAEKTGVLMRRGMKKPKSAGIAKNEMSFMFFEYAANECVSMFSAIWRLFNFILINVAPAIYP